MRSYRLQLLVSSCEELVCAEGTVPGSSFPVFASLPCLTSCQLPVLYPGLFANAAEHSLRGIRVVDVSEV